MTTNGTIPEPTPNETDVFNPFVNQTDEPPVSNVTNNDTTGNLTITSFVFFTPEIYLLPPGCVLTSD